MANRLIEKWSAQSTFTVSCLFVRGSVVLNDTPMLTSNGSHQLDHSPLESPFQKENLGEPDGTGVDDGVGALVGDTVSDGVNVAVIVTLDEGVRVPVGVGVGGSRPKPTTWAYDPTTTPAMAMTSPKNTIVAAHSGMPHTPV